MKNILLLTGTAVVSILSSSAQAQGVVYSEDFDSFAVTSVNAGVHELGGTTPEVTHGQFFSSSSEVIASGTTLDFTSGNANRTRGAGVWLDTSAWVAGTVTVTFDVSGFVAAVGPDSGAYIQTYTASGVDGSNPVGVDIHGSFNAGVALNGTASSSPLGSATVITAPDMSLTSLTHTFNYSGAGEIGLFFVNKAKNSATEPYQSATLTVDNLSVSLQAGLTIEPNIVLFYVDDLGWQDVQLNDLDTACPYETPNLVALAASGMNFPQAYSPAPTCAPSRGAINTGQHPAKTRFTNVTVNDRSDGRAVERLIAPYLDEQLDPTLLTSADVLKANGYSTGHSGKWHVGLTGASYGFDTVNHQRGPHRSMNPDRNTFAAFATASDPNYPLSMEKYAPFGGSFPQGISYPEDEVTESALQFMEDNKNGPFFLNLCHWMVHYPILTRNKDLLQYYSEKFMHAPDPNPEAGWTGESWNPPLTGDVEWTAPGQNNPYFAAMVTTVDWSLGRIVSYLEATDDPRYPGMKLIDTTYIFFTSDNGGAETRGLEIISENEPLRGKKGNTTDGGIRVPMVVAGPGIAAGSEFNTIVNQLDYFPTFLSLTDTTIAQADFDELSGADLEPVLHGTSAQVIDPVTQLEREFLFWHFPHYGTMYAAVRSGDFKLHYSYDTEIYELYRLSNNGVRVDIEEVVDLAGDPAHAAPLAQLTAMLDGALVANNAELPYLNPNYTGVDPATVAVPDVSSYDSATRSAQLTIDGVGPKIVDAFVIYVTPELNPGDNEVVTEQYMGGMREAAVLSVDGYSVSADIPLSIDSYCFMLVDENGFMQYTDEVASPLFVGPPVILAHWPLDEDSGNQAADISGNDHHATVTGADWSVGVSGGALYFDGINNDTAAIPAGAVSGLDSQVSIAMWAYGGATQPANDVAFYATNLAESRLLNIHLPWSNEKVFWDAGLSDRIISAVVPVENYKGKWNHWVFTKDATAGSMTIYLNGAPFYTETAKTESMTGITQVWFGGSNSFGNASYEGLLDEVILYDGALSDTEVATLYSSYTLPTDYSTWLLNYPGLSDVTFEGDPEQDGIATGLEFVLNGTPTGPDQILLPELDAKGVNFVFTFTRSAEAVPFTEQTFQYGSTLSGWTDLNITEPRATEVSLGSITGGLQEVTVTIPKSLAVDGKLFGRLKVDAVSAPVLVE